MGFCACDRAYDACLAAGAQGLGLRARALGSGGRSGHDAFAVSERRLAPGRARGRRLSRRQARLPLAVLALVLAGLQAHEQYLKRLG